MTSSHSLSKKKIIIQKQFLKDKTKIHKKKINSVEVQPLSLYRNEVRWRKENTTPCWRKEITVGAILDQQMRREDWLHTLLECWVSWRHC